MKKNNFTYRKARWDDDFVAIAKYIHSTDPYIYPSICEDFNDPLFVKLIGDCLRKKSSLFYYGNISLALLDEKIVGVLCAVRCGEKMTFLEGLDLPSNELARIDLSYQGYFLPLIEESLSLSGYNITNLCVDSDFRCQGVGEGLLRFYLSQQGNEPVHLDVIADNLPAIRLYQKCGFKIENEYFGFSGTSKPLLCYRMTRK